jgi:hypothetical protein
MAGTSKKKEPGIQFRCVYCKTKWTLPFEEAAKLEDMPRCPNSRPEVNTCGGFGVVESATNKHGGRILGG